MTPFQLFFLSGSISALLMVGCAKNPPQDNFRDIPDPGKFTAYLNNEGWRPEKHEAVYFPSYRQLYITASDSGMYRLYAGINIDSVNPLKEYLLESNGDNAAEISKNSERFISDQNVADAGGVFLLTKLDTIQKKMSGIMKFTAYSSTRKDKIVFSSDTIIDIPLHTANAKPIGSNAFVTVKGAKTTFWHIRNLIAKVTCISNNVDKTIEIQLMSILGGFPLNRYLLFKLPLHNTAGTYPVKPDLPPFFYCGSDDITARYNNNNYDNSYFATSGTFIIKFIDTASKKLQAEFNLIVKDTSAAQEVIEFTNGQIKLESWQNP